MTSLLFRATETELADFSSYLAHRIGYLAGVTFAAACLCPVRSVNKLRLCTRIGGKIHSAFSNV